MFVVKRSGERTECRFDAITDRLKPLAVGLSPSLDIPAITQKVVDQLHSGITTTAIDDVVAQTCAYKSQEHPDYSTLAGRLAVTNLQKNNERTFCEMCQLLRDFVDTTGRDAPLMSEAVMAFVVEHKDVLEAAIDYSRDLDFDFFGFKTLERGYLMKAGAAQERPQHMLMRVACGIHYAQGDVESALQTYDLMSRRMFTHATPTLFNAGTTNPQMSSCFLLSMKEDSITGIFDTLKQCAVISRGAGGIGLSVSNVRAAGSYIRGTNGTSNGVLPMLRLFNDSARYVDQGGGKRKGAFAIYMEPWHADIEVFLELKKNHGKDENRARDLFLALWVPDLFMERVRDDEKWTLFCPNEAPGLYDLVGEEFKKKFEEYEQAGLGRRTIRAQTLWFQILQAQIETGNPFILYKDHANLKSNQSNLGTIHSSNLCTEVVQYSSAKEVAVCNLASMALPMYVKIGEDGKPFFDLDLLREITKVVVRNLNKLIDGNAYPIPEARRSNKRHRPIGLGVQGLADTFIKMRLPFESAGARELNIAIFETLYFASCEASCELAERDGPYKTFWASKKVKKTQEQQERGQELTMAGYETEDETEDEDEGPGEIPACPASEGRLQWKLWQEQNLPVTFSGKWDWDPLLERIKKFGMRNSLLVSPMPTASTAQILGNNESIEPYTQNMYVRRVLAGEFVQVNRHLLTDLSARGLWNTELKQKLVAHNGSVQHLDEVPQDLKDLYKTVWEIKQRAVLDLAADRAPFVDQSQSMNVYMLEPSTAKLSSMHFYGWSRGLKTGMYYLRTQAAADAIKITVDVKTAQSASAVGAAKEAPSLSLAERLGQKDEPECLSCGA